MPLEKSDFEALARRLALRHAVTSVDNAISISWRPIVGPAWNSEWFGQLTNYKSEQSNSEGVCYLIRSLRQAGIEFQIRVTSEGFELSRRWGIPARIDATDERPRPYPTLTEALVRFINSLSITLPVPTS